MFKFILLASLASVALADMKNKCPWVMGKYPFEEAKMAGEWYIVSANKHLGKPCGRVAFSSKDGTHNLKYTAVDDTGKAVNGEIIAQLLFKDKPGGSPATSLAVWKKEDGTYSGTFKETIVATDYDKYAVVLACGNMYNPTTSNFDRKMKVAILSRTKTLPVDSLAILKSLVTSYDIPYDSIVDVSHEKC